MGVETVEVAFRKQSPRLGYVTTRRSPSYCPTSDSSERRARLYCAANSSRLTGNKMRLTRQERTASAGGQDGSKNSRKEKTYMKRKDNPLLSFEFEGFKKKTKKK